MLDEVIKESGESTALRVVDVDYTTTVGREGTTIPHLFCRDEDGEEVHIEVVGHNPSFYVRDESQTRRDKLRNDNRVVSVETGHTALEGDALLRVYTKVPDDVPELRSNFDDTWEADVWYIDRVMLDIGATAFIEIPTDVSGGSKNVQRTPEYGDRCVHIDDIKPLSPENAGATASCSPRVCIFDIEVERPENGGIPKGSSPHERVTGITAYDSYTEEYMTWVLQDERYHDEDDFGVVTVGSKEIDYEVCETENELLYSFNTWMGVHSPDLVSGWNSTDFDLPYLIGRCEYLNERSYFKWCRLNDEYNTGFVNSYNRVYLDGIETLDMLEAFKRTQRYDLESNSLESVSETVLGEDSPLGKKGGLDEDEAYREDIEEFIEYNYRDVSSVVAINDEEDLLQTYNHLREVSGARYSECHHAFGIIDMTLLHRASTLGVALPTSSTPDTDWYHGGHVFDYQAGKHFNVVYPDLKSLYPQTFLMLNVSPETFIGDETDLALSEYTEDDCHVGYIDKRPVKVAPTGSDYDEYKDGTYKAIQRISSDGKKETIWTDTPKRAPVYYLKRSVKEGFVSGAVSDLVDMKYEYKGEGKYEAIKRITNAVYGVFGDCSTYGKGYRLYDDRLAETITLAGRDILKKTASGFLDYVQNNGAKRAYLVGGDTDSVITSLSSHGVKTEVIDLSTQACEHLNKEVYPEFIEKKYNADGSYMEVELESYSPSMLVPRDLSVKDDDTAGTKKRYAQWVTWDDGEEVDEVNIKGLEAIRSDASVITKEVQREVLEYILRESLSTAKEKSYRLVREVVADIHNGEVGIEKVAKRKGITKNLVEYGDKNRRPTTVVRGAKYATAHIEGEDLSSGGKPLKVFISDTGDLPSTYTSDNTPEDGDEVDCIAVESVYNLPESISVDWDEHIERTLLQPLRPIFEAVGWNLREATKQRRQTTLEERR